MTLSYKNVHRNCAVRLSIESLTVDMSLFHGYRQKRFMVFTSGHPAVLCGQLSIREMRNSRDPSPPRQPDKATTGAPVLRISEHLPPRWQVIYHVDIQGLLFEP
jgi:hypothetical protein